MYHRRSSFRPLVAATAVLTTTLSFAQTTVNGSFVHGGITRTYSFHVPASYTPDADVPLVLGLHGTGSSGADFAQYRDFRPIADTANFIMVHPDGSTFLGVRFWNYGNVFGSSVDDVGFLEALIDTISAQYSIDPQRVYATGMSNGSFMCYALACQSDRFAAVGTVAGSMSVDQHAACAPAYPTPVIHIHGTDDGINPYEGTSTMVGIDTLMSFWVQRNDGSPIPITTMVPDLDPGDGATAEHRVYTVGINDHTVEHFKVIGGGHSWPGCPYPGSTDNTCMDFDARLEIWRFFRQYARNAATSVEDPDIVSIEIWPNPTTGYIHLRSESDRIDRIEVLDLRGERVHVAQPWNGAGMDLGPLPCSTYLVRIIADERTLVRKVVVQ